MKTIVLPILGLLATLFQAQALQVSIGTASIHPNQSVNIPVTTDNAEGIRAAAFTVAYDTRALQVTATSDFFAVDSPSAYLEATGPHSFLAVPNAQGLAIAGARSSAASPGEAILLTLVVTLLPEASSQNYTISILPTSVALANAGYSSEAEPLNLLVSNVVLLGPATYSTKVVPGSVSYDSAVADADGDGLPDAWEKAHYGKLTLADPNDDTDGDGLTTIMELFMGSDPLVAETGLGLRPTAAEDGFRVHFPMNRDHTLDYQIEWSSNLQNWEHGGVILSERSDLGQGDNWTMMEAFVRASKLPSFFVRLVIDLRS